MRIVLDGYNLEEQKEIAKKFREAPCIVCDKKMQGYRKIPVGGKITFLPLCNDCKGLDVETLTNAMEMIDNATPMVKTRSGS